MSDVQTDNTMALYHALERIDELEAQNEALRQQLQQMMTAELKTAVDYAEAFILRKQAEAIDEMAVKVKEALKYHPEVVSVGSVYEGLLSYSAHYRQQADDLEEDQK